MPAALRRRPPSQLILAAVMVLAAAVVFWQTHGVSLFADEWTFFIHRRALSAQTLLDPNNGNLAAVPILLYRVVFGAFGPDILVLRLILVVLELVVAVLFFELVRRRVGSWIALGATTVLLFLGSSYMIVTTGGITLLLAAAFGLGALLALERADLPGDLAACGLLCLALATYSAALAFLAGAIVAIALRPPPLRWRTAWVAGIPLVLYAAWRIWAQQVDNPIVSKTVVKLTSVGTAPSFVADSLAAAMASLSGLFRLPGLKPLSFSHEWGVPLAVILAAAVAARVWLSRRPAGLRDLWVWLAIPLTYWLALSLASQQGNTPALSHLILPRNPDIYYYQYFGVMMVLLLAAAAASGLAISQRVLIVLGLCLPVALVPNLVTLHEASVAFRADGETVRAELGAVELAGARAAPVPVETVQTRPDYTTLGVLDVPEKATDYLAAARQYGRAGLAPSSIAQASEPAREAADKVLARVLRLRPLPQPRLPAAAAAGPVSEGAGSARLSRSGACIRAVPRPGSVAQLALRLPPGGFAVRPAAGASPQLQLRRFADQFSVPLAPLSGGSPALVRIPADSSPLPWHLMAEASRPLRICSLGR